MAFQVVEVFHKGEKVFVFVLVFVHRGVSRVSRVSAKWHWLVGTCLWHVIKGESAYHNTTHLCGIAPITCRRHVPTGGWNRTTFVDLRPLHAGGLSLPVGDFFLGGFFCVVVGFFCGFCWG